MGVRPFAGLSDCHSLSFGFMDIAMVDRYMAGLPIISNRINDHAMDWIGGMDGSAISNIRVRIGIRMARVPAPQACA
jgi:hypothetical protein